MHLVVSSFVAGAAFVGAIVVTWHPDQRRRHRFLIFLVAVLTRALTAAAISIGLATAGRAVLFSDERLYLSEAAAARSGSWASHGYSNVLGVLFRFAGQSSWLPRFLNVTAGALLAVVVYELIHQLLGDRAAVVGGAVIALWPSLILWSAVVLKDSFVLLGLFAAVLAMLKFSFGDGGVAWGVIAVVGMLAAEYLRPFSFVVLGFAICCALLVSAITRDSRKAPVFLTALICAGAIGLLGGDGFLGATFIRQEATTTAVAFARTHGSVGNTRFATPAPQTPGAVLIGMPRGLFFSVFGPFPWQPGSILARVLLVFELPVWYLTIALAAVAVVRLGVRRLLSNWSLLLAFAVGSLVILSIFEGNAATALRERSMVIPVFVAAAVSLFARSGATADQSV